MRACCLASRQRRARVRACLRSCVLALACWRARAVRARARGARLACVRASACARARMRACARARARAMRGARAGMRVCAPCVRVCVHAASARARACACASCTCACVRARARQFNFFPGRLPPVKIPWDWALGSGTARGPEEARQEAPTILLPSHTRNPFRSSEVHLLRHRLQEMEPQAQRWTRHDEYQKKRRPSQESTGSRTRTPQSSLPLS